MATSSPPPSSPPPQEPTASSPLASPADVVWPTHILSYSELDLKAAAISHYTDSLILPQLDTPGSKLEYSGLGSTLLGAYFPPHHAELDLSRRFEPLLLHKYSTDLEGLLPPHVLEGIPGGSYYHQDLFHPLVPSATPPTQAAEDQELVERLSSYPVLPPVSTTSSGQPRFLDTPNSVLLPSEESTPTSEELVVQDEASPSFDQPLQTSDFVSAPSKSPPSVDSALELLPPSGEPQVVLEVLPVESSFLREEQSSEIPPEYQELANHYSRTHCEECRQTHRGGCPNQTIKLILDKPVQTRAWASLPASYLYVAKVPGVDALGVFAKKSIPKRTQFGPVEGVLVHPDTTSLPPQKFLLKVTNSEGQDCFLDTSDEMKSNWMPFVRPAERSSQQNLAVVQQGSSIYYLTTRAINIRSELRVWYSEQYAQLNDLPLLLPSSEEQSQEDTWPCFECEAKFATSSELQLHLNEHDQQRIGHHRTRHRRPNRKREAEKMAVSKYKKLKGKKSKDKANDTASQRSANLPEGAEPPAAPPQQAPPTEKRVYICTTCHKTFPRIYNLQRHMMLHSGEKKYQCPICGIQFSQVYNRNRHVRRHKMQPEVSRGKNASSYKTCRLKPAEEKECVQCQLEFPTPQLLALHCRCHADPPQESSQEPHLCPFCNADFPEGQALADHVRVHAKPKTFKCNVCYKKYTTEERLSQHMALHSGNRERPYICTVCHKNFINTTALACHLRVHTNDSKAYKCPFCEEKYEYSFALRNHVKVHLINEKFHCPHCVKTFSEYNSARKHIRTYHGDAKFICKECGKEFTRPDKLRLHMLRHSDHREFLCSVCGKQFKRKDKLKDHMQRVHDPEREAALAALMAQRAKNKFVPKVSPSEYHRFIYKCHLCLLGFKRRGMLVNHLAKRHPEVSPDSVPELNLPILKTTRDYYCQYCSKVYKSCSKRKAHILKNHPNSSLLVTKEEEVPELVFSHTSGSITTHPHHCPCCHKQYASRAKLMQHERRKHPELYAKPGQDTTEVVSTSQEQQPPSPAESPTDTSTAAADPPPETDESTPPSTCLTQMSAALAELLLAQRVGGTSSIVIDTTRQRIYVEGSATTSVVTPVTNSDVLTQAMSELTQALAENRSPTGQYLITRVVPQDSTAQLAAATMMVDSTEDGANLTTVEQILTHFPHLGFPPPPVEQFTFQEFEPLDQIPMLENEVMQKDPAGRSRGWEN